MAGNNHEGLGDEFFEQILTGPPGSYPPMALQLSSGGGVGGSGIGGMLPLGLNLEQSVGSGFRDDIGGNSLLNVTLLLLHHLSSPIYIHRLYIYFMVVCPKSWQMESGLVHTMDGGLFPTFGQLQPPPLRQAPPPLPQLGGPALHQVIPYVFGRKYPC